MSTTTDVVTVNLDPKPRIMEGSCFRVTEHQPGGHIEWDPRFLSLWRFPTRLGVSPTGHLIREALREKLVGNATLLDWLHENPDQISENIMNEMTLGNLILVFFGTTFECEGKLYVMYLAFEEGRLRKIPRCLDHPFMKDVRVVILTTD